MERGRHPKVAAAALFTHDASLVTSKGDVLRGGEIERRTAMGFATIFASNRMHLGETDVRSLSADVGVARVLRSISGVRSSTGDMLRPRQIVQTQVLVRVGASWRLAQLQDTVVLDDDQASPGIAANIASGTAAPAVMKPHRRYLVGRANGACLIYGKQ